MQQYAEYGTIPQGVRDLVANKCQLLDQYVLMQTGAREYTALIRNLVTDTTTQLVVSRTDTYGVYTVVESEGVWDYAITNEYYCYSNVGKGAALDLPVNEGVTAHASAVIISVLMLAIMFKGVLFKCLDRAKLRR